MEQLIRMQHLDRGTRVVFTCQDEQELPENQIILKAESRNSISVKVDAVVDMGWPNLAGEIATGMPLIIIKEEYAKELFGREPRWVDVYLSGNGLNMNDVREILPANKYVIYDLYNVMDEAVTQMQAILILISHMIVALIGLVVFMITSIVKQNFEHRRKEIGMMRAIGASQRRMERMLCGEVYILVILACMLASVLVAPVSMYVYEIINGVAGIGTTGYLIGMRFSRILT